MNALLDSRRIMITRPASQGGDFELLLQENGAQTVSFPLISICPPENWIQLDSSIQKIQEYDWLIFTSVNGVSFFEQRLDFLKKKEQFRISKCNILSIGPVTSKAIENLLEKEVFACPNEYTSEGIIEFLKDIDIREDNFLLPRALVARQFLPVQLRLRGAQVDVVPAYQTEYLKFSESSHFFSLLFEGKVDMVTFLSSSSVNAFVDCFTEEQLQKVCKNTDFACIGPITASTALEYGLPLSVESDVSTTAGLTQKIVEFYDRN